MTFRMWYLIALCFSIQVVHAQITIPVNGVADPRTKKYAFTNATIFTDAANKIDNGTLLVQEGKIIAVGKPAIPSDAVIVDCKGKYIYPSFIDLFSDYGLPQQEAVSNRASFFGPQQFNTNTKGPYGWNQAIRSEYNAAENISTDEKKAAVLRTLGFGVVLSHLRDGIARGTGTAVTLADKKENLTIIKDKAAAFYSFNKGTSSQSYPGSMMGAVALLRQTFLDAQWYSTHPEKEGVNKSLEAWNAAKALPQIFEATEKWSDLRADKIGDEFGIQYIIKGGGNEYQRIQEIAATKAPYIIGVNYPDAQNIEDPADARFVSLGDMAHWELAPSNAAALEKAGITFAFTAADLKDPRQFLPNIRKAIANGLSETAAFNALTKIPATLINVYDKTGSLESGKLANFIITSGKIFDEKTTILENCVQGELYQVSANPAEQQGKYILSVKSTAGTKSYTVNVKNNSQAAIGDKPPTPAKFKISGSLVSISFTDKAENKQDSAKYVLQPTMYTRLSGIMHDTIWEGTGINSTGEPVTWTAVKSTTQSIAANDSSSKLIQPLAKVHYPFNGYGNETLPMQETILIKNATVWTNEAAGRLDNTDVLLKNGKIAQVGKNISAAGARIIDGTGKFLTPGIIDEHSHIAAFSINEGAQSVTSEVRMGDNLNPEDINIYRQLSGGVTTSQILHGSANTIGGQSQLIKLRWGQNAEGLKFEGADPFIKFALGENVKRTAQTQGNTRFPDTRMGVEEVLSDAFQRAKDYESAMKTNPAEVRRDLELDALVEILNNKRFITCHSYVQSEILALINVAEKYGFKVNTFTHVLEGYKIADRIKAHGSNVSTFSDWWAYKNEVKDANAYNAAIMQKTGLNVCINSDDAEMARRLNQEAAKTIKYGGVTEDEAFKMITLNPAKALHIDDRVGSIKVGKDADVVLWSHNPLSIYAKALYTIIDGTVYYDQETDLLKRAYIQRERNRLIQKMMGAVKSGASTVPVRPTPQVVLHCEDNEHDKGILTVDGFDADFAK